MLLDLVVAVKACLDIDLEIILNVLIRKGTETSVFLSLPANDALKALCENCSEGRVATALLGVMSGHQKYSPQVKLRVISCIELLLQRIGNKLPNMKEGEKLVQMLSTCLSEGSLEVRSAAKNAFSTASRVVLNSIDFDRLLQRALHDHLYNKVKELISSSAPESSLNDSFLIMGSNTKKISTQQPPKRNFLF